MKTKQQKQQEQSLSAAKQQLKKDTADLHKIKLFPDAKLTGREKKRLARAVKKAKRDGKLPQTAQQTIPYEEMYRDGICRVTPRYFTKQIQFFDLNYQLAQNEDKNQIFESYCDFLNCATRSHTNAIPLTKNSRAQDHVALKVGGFRYCVEATTDILKSGMMG